MSVRFFVLLAIAPWSATAARAEVATPAFEMAWRLLNDGNAAAGLEPGGAYELEVTITPAAGEGYRLDPRVKSHEVSLPGAPRRSGPVRSKSARVDPVTGRAVLPLTVAEDAAADQLPGALAIKFSGVASSAPDLRWCAAVESGAELALPSGRAALVARPLRYGAGKTPRKILSVGDAAPGFAVTNPTGETIQLADYAGKQPLVILFSRGHW